MPLRKMTCNNVLVLLVIVCQCHGSLVRQEISPYDSRARCNDGTSPVFYHSAGMQSNKYIVHLEGDGFCDSVSECDTRCYDGAYLCTTMDESEVTKDGHLTEDPAVNPLFADYYKVWLHYCSSDNHIGESEPTPENGGYYFQGRHNVHGMITALQSMAGLSSGDELILSGTSAGGRGAAFNCEYVAALLPDVDVKCIVDAAIFYPRFTEAPFDPACQPFNELISESNAFWNGSVTNFDINTWWVTMTKPLFIGFSVFDDFGFIYYCGNPSDSAHAQIWADGMYDVTQDLLVEAPHVGLFLPGCFTHVLLESTFWYTSVHAGSVSQSYMATLTNWINGDANIHAWDACTSDPYNCSPECT